MGFTHRYYMAPLQGLFVIGLGISCGKKGKAKYKSIGWNKRSDVEPYDAIYAND